MADNFYITLPSNACTDLFPGNATGGYYKTLLPQEIKLDSNNWEVGLSEITYVANSWDNVREGENEVRLTIETADASEHMNQLGRHGIFGGPKVEEMILARRLLSASGLYKITLLIHKNGKPGGEVATDQFVIFDYKRKSPVEYYTWKDFVREVNDVFHTTFKSVFKDSHIILEESGGFRVHAVNVDHAIIENTRVNLHITQDLAKHFNLSSNVIELPFSFVESVTPEKLSIPKNVIEQLSNILETFKFRIEPRNYDSIPALLRPINEGIYEVAPYARNHVRLKWSRDMYRVEWECKFHFVKLDMSMTLSKLLGFTKSNLISVGTGTLLAPDPPNLQFSLSTLWVYTDIK